MREKELRLALVCYGGVSLAVYMHGITKELWRLARASRAFHDNSICTPGSETIYRELLERIGRDKEIKLRVLIDVIAGSSAGGVNGIFLGQAITTGQSLEPLTQLWLERADVEVLLDPDARPLSRFTKFWAVPIAWLVMRLRGRTVRRTVAIEARAEVRRKLSGFVRARWFHPPFGGVTFTNLVLDAFDAMAAVPAGPPLLPEGQPLDLSVTVTDFHGYNQRLRLHSPAIAQEREHRLTIAFTDRGVGQRSLADPAELTFAARATASFPGAFPPFNVAEIDKVLKSRERTWPGREAFLHRILPKGIASGSPEDLVLIDGSVLANAPFGPAIDALRNRPARREVDRRFVYLDPIANIDPARERSREGLVRPPGFFTTIFGAMSTIPREQPIRDNLELIEQRSRGIADTRRIIEAIRPEVDTAIESALGRQLLLLYRPSAERIGGWRSRAHQDAARQAGFTYAGYGQLKLTIIANELASTIALLSGIEEPAGQHVIRALIGEEMRKRGFEEPEALRRGGTSEAVIQFLRDHDLGFRIRRLRFLADRLTELEHGDGGSSEEALQAARDAIYGSLAPFLDLQMRDHYASPVVGAAQLFEEAEAGLAMIAAIRNLAALDLDTDKAIAGVLPALSKPDRRALLFAYLGFSFYDLATLSLMRQQGGQEFHAIQVDRISPDDAGSIRKGGAAATLKGIEFNMFGAFFSRAYRENDYLWGRLHGAERLIDIVVSTLPTGEIIPAPEISELKRALFEAILDEEQSRLTAIPDQIVTIRRELGMKEKRP